MKILWAFATLLVPACGLNTFGLTIGQSASDLTHPGSDTASPSGFATDTGSDTSHGIGDSASDSTTAASGDSTGCVMTVWYFDIDKDGYGGPMSAERCGWPGPGYTLDSLDCNDADSKINPDAVELCDSLDNDCDGGIDEYPASDMMGACNGCMALIGVSSTYYFCDTPERDWDGARAKCKTLLGDLVVIGDVMERTYIIGASADFGLRWWVGLGDSANEGQFVWVDGSDLDPYIPTWALDEPDNTDPSIMGPANCIDMAAFIGGWRDQSCIDLKPFICEAPLPS